MIAIDDAIFLDAHSWALLLRMSREVDNLLILVATRPINKSNMAAFATVAPEEFTELLSDPQTTLVTLEPRPDHVIYAMACELIGKDITEIPSTLAEFILRKAHGNPLVSLVVSAS